MALVRRALLATTAACAAAYLAPARRSTPVAPLAAAPGGLAVLQRKAQEAKQKKFLESLDDEDPVVKAMNAESASGRDAPGFGEVRRRLKRQKRGALGVVAEFNKKVPAALKAIGVQEYEIPDINLVSTELRGAGANVMAINMESVAGGCDDADFAYASLEQASAKEDFPGPLPLVWMDAVVDEVQLARAKIAGAVAVTLGLETLGAERCKALFDLAETKYGLEALVICAPRAAGADGLGDLLQSAINDVGAQVIIVGGVDQQTKCKAVVESDVVLVARVDAHDNQGLEEAEEAWDLRDAGYDAVWVSDVLYKFGSFSGNLFASSPDSVTSVIKAVKSKASTKFARASGAFSGKGEGAKEHLGDLLM